MARWVRFTKMYDHRWPSRAMTNFPAGTVAFVKDEVADRAIGKGRAEETDKPEPGDEAHVTTQSSMESAPRKAHDARDEAPPTAEHGSPDRVAEHDDADDVGAGVRVAVQSGPGKRRRPRRGS